MGAKPGIEPGHQRYERRDLPLIYFAESNVGFEPTVSCLQNRRIAIYA